MFTDYTDFNKDITKAGIVRLWFKPNVQDTKWEMSGNIKTHCSYYFVLPADVINENGSLKFNARFKYIKKNVKVFHRGVNYSEDFWRIEPVSPISLQLETSDETKLPYIVVPDLGEPNYTREIRYLIPLNEVC